MDRRHTRIDEEDIRATEGALLEGVDGQSIQPPQRVTPTSTKQLEHPAKDLARKKRLNCLTRSGKWQ